MYTCARKRPTPEFDDDRKEERRFVVVRCVLLVDSPCGPQRLAQELERHEPKPKRERQIQRQSSWCCYSMRVVVSLLLWLEIYRIVSVRESLGSHTHAAILSSSFWCQVSKRQIVRPAFCILREDQRFPKKNDANPHDERANRTPGSGVREARFRVHE